MFNVQAACAHGAASDIAAAASVAVRALEIFIIILLLHLQAHFPGVAIH
jgi:hypothetical protein